MPRFFIETCAPWVVPYIADLVGTSHLKGDPRTLRADTAPLALLAWLALADRRRHE